MRKIRGTYVPRDHAELRETTYSGCDYAWPVAKPNAADDEIARILEEDPQPGGTWVVTSDRRLADQARAAGAAVEGADAFRRRIGER